LIPVGTPLPSEEAADSAEEINELASEGVPPKAEVTSLAIEVATETIELTRRVKIGLSDGTDGESHKRGTSRSAC